MSGHTVDPVPAARMVVVTAGVDRAVAARVVELRANDTDPLAVPSYVTRHVTRLTAATLLIVGSMVLPFLPGRYDAFAVALSGMSQIFAVVGPVLVPFGAVWLAYEIGMRRKRAAMPPRHSAGFWIAMVSIGAASLIGLVISVAARWRKVPAPTQAADGQLTRRMAASLR